MKELRLIDILKEMDRGFFLNYHRGRVIIYYYINNNIIIPLRNNGNI